MPAYPLPPGLKTTFVTDEQFFSLIEEEKALVREVDRLREEFRQIAAEKDAKMRELQNQPRAAPQGDDFEKLLAQKNAAHQRLDNLRLIQTKISSKRDDLEILAFELGPIDAEISEIFTKIDDSEYNLKRLESEQAAKTFSLPFKKLADADQEISRIDEQIEEARKGGNPNPTLINGLARQKAAAEKGRRDVQSSYELDERILKERSRVDGLRKDLEAKRNAKADIIKQREELKEALADSKSLNPKFDAVRKELSEIKAAMDKIQAERKARAVKPANPLKSVIQDVNDRLTEVRVRRDETIKKLDKVNQQFGEFRHDLSYNVEHRKALIGKNGATMDGLMQDFGVALYLDGPNKNKGELSVFGPKENAEAALEAIKQILEEAASSNLQEVVDFDPNQTKSFIGLKGANVDRMQSASGARIKLDGDKITLSGTSQAIESAKELIREFKDNAASDQIRFDKAITDIVIGKGGSVVRRIERESGVKNIRVNRDLGLIVFSGHKDSVAVAKGLYEDLIQTMTKNTITLPANDKVIRLVVGPQGKTVREIEDASGASVTAQSRGPNHSIVIRGTKEQVEQARLLVEDVAFREETKIPFDPAMYTYLTTRPREEADGEGQGVERLSPLEAIREQFDCDQVSAIRGESKIVIRGRAAAVAEAKALTLQVLKKNMPPSSSVAYPAVLFPYLTKGDGKQRLDAIRDAHSTAVLAIDVDKLNKIVAVVGHPTSTFASLEPARGEVAALVDSYPVAVLTVPASRIGTIIGPKGKTINAIQEETGTLINVDKDEGSVVVFSSTGDKESVQKAIEQITLLRDQ